MACPKILFKLFFLFGPFVEQFNLWCVTLHVICKCNKMMEAEHLETFLSVLFIICWIYGSMLLGLVLITQFVIYRPTFLVLVLITQFVIYWPTFLVFVLITQFVIYGPTFLVFVLVTLFVFYWTTFLVLVLIT